MRKQEEERISRNLKIIDNIYHVCKLRDMKIGDVEQKIDVHKGFFAKKRRYQAPLGFAEVYEAAKELGVTVDELADKDFSRKAILKELDKLERKKEELLKKELQEIERRKEEILRITETEKKAM